MQASEKKLSEFYVRQGDYWLKRAYGQGDKPSWINSKEITKANLPSKFYEHEVEHIQRIMPQATSVAVDQVDFFQPTPETAQQPSPEPTLTSRKEPRPKHKLRVKLKASEGKETTKNKSPEKEEHSDWLEHVPVLFLWLLLGLMLLGIGVAIVLNVKPFIEMAKLIIGDAGIIGWIPVIGWVLNSLKMGLAVVVGIAWYAISQALELAPTLMTASDKRTLRMINAVLNHSGLEIKAGDAQELRWLKSKYNNRPIASLAFFRACRLFVYTMELVICWITHPPIQGNPADFLIALVTGQFSKINWGNVFLTLSVLFLVEILVRIALHTITHIHADRQLARAEKEAQSR